LEKLKADGFYGADYHYSVYKKGEWFPEAKKLGLTINAWTVNSAEDMKWLLKNKVEFITTNEPELAFETISSMPAENK
jgi:glycerophosphoryl diester phosphodiesterase